MPTFNFNLVQGSRSSIRRFCRVESRRSPKIAYRNGDVFVANTERGQLVRVPINPDGSAGIPEVLVANPDQSDPATLFGADGIALDVHGDIYVVNAGSSALLRFPADGDGPGDVEIITTAGLFGPASLAFGSGKGERQSVFIVNFDFFTQTNPGLVKVDVGVPGLPLP